MDRISITTYLESLQDCIREFRDMCNRYKGSHCTESGIFIDCNSLMYSSNYAMFRQKIVMTEKGFTRNGNLIINGMDSGH